MAKIINLSPVRSTFLVMAFLGFATIFSSETSASVIIPYDSPSLASLRNLIHDDTPAGLAQATVLLGEIVLMHKSTQAASTAGAAALNRTKQALNKFASFVEEEQSLALAAQAAGKVVDTPRVDMIKNARDLAVLASEEGIGTAGKAWLNALEGNGKIVINATSKVAAVSTNATQNIPLQLPAVITTPQSVIDRIASAAMPGRCSKKVTQFVKIGGNTKAYEEFWLFNPNNVTTTQNAKGVITTGTLPDGRTINTRPYSSGDAATLEIINPQTQLRIKFRYVDQLSDAAKFQ